MLEENIAGGSLDSLNNQMEAPKRPPPKLGQRRPPAKKTPPIKKSTPKPKGRMSYSADRSSRSKSP